MRQLTNAIGLSQLDGIGRNQFRSDTDCVSSGNDEIRCRLLIHTARRDQWYLR